MHDRHSSGHEQDVVARRKTIQDLLDAAQASIRRLEPAEAFAAMEAGALLIDIRSDDARCRHGCVPGAVHVPRTVLEWRLDPASPWCDPALVDLGRELVLICDHGYSSSLAAAGLFELGFVDVADVVGGFEAWAAAGLPVADAVVQ